MDTVAECVRRLRNEADAKFKLSGMHYSHYAYYSGRIDAYDNVLTLLKGVKENGTGTVRQA